MASSPTSLVGKILEMKSRLLSQESSLDDLISLSSPQFSDKSVAKAFCEVIESFSSSSGENQQLCGQHYIIKNVTHIQSLHLQSLPVQRSAASSLISLTLNNSFHAIEAVSGGALESLCHSFLHHSEVLSPSSSELLPIVNAINCLIQGSSSCSFSSVSTDFLAALESSTDLKSFLLSWKQGIIETPFKKIPRSFILSTVSPELDHLKSIIAGGRDSLNLLNDDLTVLKLKWLVEVMKKRR
ncbi:hypothetical protein GEMRC1_005317 [Eukaryota sp. GEM-RC1]